MHLCPQEEKRTSSSWGDSEMCTHLWDHSKLTDKHKMPNQIKKGCCCQSKDFSWTRDIIRHLKAFRVISNEMLVSLLILWWYNFIVVCTCIQINFLMFIFVSKCFLKSFLQSKSVSFLEIIAWTVKFSLTNFHVFWRLWF